MSAQGQAAPAASAGGATGAAAAAAQRPKATKEAAQEFHQMCLVRQVQQSFETVREQAKANNVDLGEQLQNMGYARFEDFILKCEKFSFFCDPMDFAELGAGMVLYFDFLKYLMCLALFFFVLYTPAMLLVVGGAEDSPYLLNSWTKMPSWVTEAETTAAVAAAGLPGYAALLNARGSQKALIDTGYSAIGNVGKPGSPIDTLWQAASPGNDAMGMDKPWVIYLYLVSLFAAMASVGLYGVRQRAIDDKVDATAIHPNDYAIFVRNLPVEEGEEENIRAYFEQNALEGGQLADIAKVVIAWDITEFKKITDKQAAIGKSYFKLLKSGVDATDERALSIKEEFKAATEELKKLKSGENLQGSGIAIVVFASQRQQRDCLDKWESSIWMSFAHFLGENFELHCLESFCAWMNGTPLYGGRGGRLLKVQRAPNPTDVNWSDLGHGKIEIILKQMQLYAAMGVLIGICFLLTYLLQRWSDDMDSEGGGSNGASVVPALVVAVLNGALMWASRNFTQYEYHETKTSEDGSTTKKMTAAMIINTAIIQFLVYAEDEKWFVENGLVVQMFFMVMIHSFLLPWFTLFDLPFFIKQMTVRKINWATNKIPQEKVNNLFTPSELDLPRRYAVALKLFITSLLVMPLFPWCLPICCTGLMLQYAVDKYMLVNSFARPKFTKDSDNAFDALQLLHLCMALFAPLMFFLFLRPACPEDEKGLLAGLLFTVLVACAATWVCPKTLFRSICKHVLCTCLCGSCELAEKLYGKEISDTAQEVDYYNAQLMWGKGMKYHKSHPLYAALPENVNPENLKREDAGARSGGVVGGAAGPSGSVAGRLGAAVVGAVTGGGAAAVAASAGAGSSAPQSTRQIFMTNQATIASNLSNVLISQAQVADPGSSMVMINANDVNTVTSTSSSGADAIVAQPATNFGYAGGGGFSSGYSTPYNYYNPASSYGYGSYAHGGSNFGLVAQPTVVRTSMAGSAPPGTTVVNVEPVAVSQTAQQYTNSYGQQQQPQRQSLTGSVLNYAKAQGGFIGGFASGFDRRRNERQPPVIAAQPPTVYAPAATVAGGSSAAYYSAPSSGAGMNVVTQQPMVIPASAVTIQPQGTTNTNAGVVPQPGAEAGGGGQPIIIQASAVTYNQ